MGAKVIKIWKQNNRNLGAKKIGSKINWKQNNKIWMQKIKQLKHKKIEAKKIIILNQIYYCLFKINTAEVYC